LSLIINKLLINLQLLLYCSAEEWSKWTFGRCLSITFTAGAEALKMWHGGCAPRRRIWGRGLSLYSYGV